LSAYLDASVLLPTLIEETASAAVDAYMLAGTQEFLVSDFAAAEVASGLLRLVRMGLLEASDASARLADFDVWRAAMSSPADIHASDVRLAAAYVRRFDLALRAPDALHLAVARRLDVPLVTLDRRLVIAARELGVAVEEPTTDSAKDQEKEMANRRSPVEDHYTRQDLGGVILAALKQAGKDIDHLTPDDLAPVDEFHGGQRPATIRLAELVGFTGTERVLDVGSGLGGPSRFLAWRYGCRVSGVDLTAEFCRVAEMLTRLTGLVGRVDYRQGNALDLPFDEMSFDVVWSQNAAMNIADRDRLYAEMLRVLKPGGKLALQEVAAGPGGPPHYPVQWARTPDISFLYSQESTRTKLEMAGFRVLVWQDTTEAALASAVARARNTIDPPAVLGTHLILGPDWQAMFRNSARNLEERRTELFNAILERVD
jgi:SAM-dependent methyltransferase/predicted nucleic acid-binding protein